MIKYNSKLIKGNVVAMALYPNIYIGKTKEVFIAHYGQYYLDKIINHESIHLAQQKELSLFKTNTFITGINFYMLYGLNWLLNILSLVRIKTAYKDICFEREANMNENNLNYLKTRKKFSWINYIF
jgi:hypothetical protein